MKTKQIYLKNIVKNLVLVQYVKWTAVKLTMEINHYLLGNWTIAANNGLKLF